MNAIQARHANNLDLRRGCDTGAELQVFLGPVVNQNVAAGEGATSLPVNVLEEFNPSRRVVILLMQRGEGNAQFGHGRRKFAFGAVAEISGYDRIDLPKTR